MENNIDISKLDIKELKALAYDFLVQSQNISNSLKAIDSEIVKRNNSIKVEENKDGK